MFAAFQIPLTDVRPFLDEPTHRVAAPAWPIVHLPDEPYKVPFVRGFGSARKRALGGIDEWPAEDAYSDLSHALRFVVAVGKVPPAQSPKSLRRYCAFRRLFWDGQLKTAGSVVGRVEVGFGLRGLIDADALGATPLAALLDAMLQQRARVAPMRRPPTEGATPAATAMLSSAGTALAKAYLRASTATESQPGLDGHEWWLQAGTPVLIVEYLREREVEALPAGTAPVALQGQTFSGIRVFLGKRRIDARERPVWYLESDPGGYSRDALRRLRINITRLHAALASLRILSDLQTRNRIQPQSAPARKNLQDCLSGYLPFLYQKEYMGFGWTDFLRGALSLSEALTPNAFATLRALHPAPGRGLRSQLDQAAEAVSAHQPSSAPPIEWDVFIAHAGKDTAVAEQLYAAIGARAKVFLDSQSVLPGDDWDLTLREAQRGAFMTVVLVSAAADAAYYLRSEIASAITLARLDQERYRVVPVYLEGAAGRSVAQPYGLNLKHGIELTDAAALSQVADRLVDTLERTRPRGA